MKDDVAVTEPLGELFDHFAAGNFEPFFAGCAADLLLIVHGSSPMTTLVRHEDLGGWIASLQALTGGSFRTEIRLALSMKRENIVIMRHTFERDGTERSYETVNRCTFREGLLNGWFSQPMDLAAYRAAWQTEGSRRSATV